MRVLTHEQHFLTPQAVRRNRGHLLTDTTWRDAHQSLLATRVRTQDIVAIGAATSHAFQSTPSLVGWKKNFCTTPTVWSTFFACLALNRPLLAGNLGWRHL